LSDYDDNPEALNLITGLCNCYVTAGSKMAMLDLALLEMLMF
jgi:hypothetical protein